MSLQLGLWPASGPTAQASKAHHSIEIDISPSFLSIRPAQARRTHNPSAVDGSRCRLYAGAATAPGGTRQQLKGLDEEGLAAAGAAAGHGREAGAAPASGPDRIKGGAAPPSGRS
jgi:hypothetical protein